MKKILSTLLLLVFAVVGLQAKDEKDAKVRQVLVIAEQGTPHQGFCDAAQQWLEAHAEKLNIQMTYVSDLSKTKKGYLNQFQLILQLNYPPYCPPQAWSKEAGADFEKYIDEGKGGYVGFHHASLLGDIFGAGPMWQWYSDFMGGIRWKDYIAPLADGTVIKEDVQHPVMQGVPGTFRVTKDEWYTYDRSPRDNVRVLARVDEDSYSIDTPVKMGDHPVIWVNEAKKARNVYFQIGHDKELFDNQAFLTMFENSIRWTLGDTEEEKQEGYAADYASAPRFRALLYWEPLAEEAHVQFDKDAINFFHHLTYGEGFLMDTTTNFSEYADKLSDYNIIIMLNSQPHGEKDRLAFQQYMEQGGGWLGFHAAAYNDRNTHWPWLNEFLGCGQFYCNNWPPQAALVECDYPDHRVTSTLPKQWVAPASEFYQWEPSPRKNKDVQVLLSISPKMYPLGIKDVVKWGDFPIAWTNTKYRMVYLNTGHGKEGFGDATQNLLFTNAFRWVVSRSPKGNPFVNKK